MTLAIKAAILNDMAILRRCRDNRGKQSTLVVVRQEFDPVTSFHIEADEMQIDAHWNFFHTRTAANVYFRNLFQKPGVVYSVMERTIAEVRHPL
jgi:hypothetical protein